MPDASLSTTSQGSWVRVQRFDAALAAAGQWAYRTDPISALTTLTTAERSGMVDILPWTASTLLVLEREFGGSFIPDFRSRLYGVDVAAASDVSALASLTGGGFTPLAKTLLWQGDFGPSNFEGMTFGAAPLRSRACPDNGPAWPTTQDGAASTIRSRGVMPPNTSE